MFNCHLHCAAGYYQNEKVFEEEPEELETDAMLGPAIGKMAPAVANPEYFEGPIYDGDFNRVWETKPQHNLCHPAGSPAFHTVPQDSGNGHKYYNDCSQFPPPLVEVEGPAQGGLLRNPLGSESQV